MCSSQSSNSKGSERDGMRLLVVGLGIRGVLFATAARRDSRVTLVAGVDNDANRCDRFRDMFGVGAYRSIHEAVERTKPNAAVIATPDDAHLEVAAACANYGLASLIEKPLATDVEEAKRIRYEFQKAGIPCMVAFENRWRPEFVYLRRKIQESGDRVLYFRANLSNRLDVPLEMLSWAARSSPGWFLGPHCVDLMLWLCDMRPVRVHAGASSGVLKSRGLNTIDSLVSTFETEDGRIGVVENHWVLPRGRGSVFDFKVEVVTERFSWSLDFERGAIVEANDSALSYPHTDVAEVQGRLVGFPYLMFSSWVDLVTQGGEWERDLDDAVRVTELVAAAHEAAQTHRVVSVGPSDTTA
ncbi:Gfo/Idh/MocA family protein [Geochorda subterranea]|uniref:Gfo/Idh/MocA family oxidoreductase n=1 Tax=Geochorda subterranea TaxID=3109564 RepID=A0ABZ1BLY0_9FIRM|nr:Gfo/Idh/MocA family oxidoreductase [Limnochorda sp. LNt]WRP13744.1 Gfo/Idh/MocA family oxidoreductase [Limnochorda sp. LNt]